MMNDAKTTLYVEYVMIGATVDSLRKRGRGKLADQVEDFQNDVQAEAERLTIAERDQ